MNSVKSRYQEVDTLLSTIKSRLESNLQVKLFEKDAMEASQNLEHWAEELKYLENQADEARATESTESWLHNQIQTANQMKALIFEIVQRGSDLVTQLEGSEVAAESLSPVAEEGSPGHGDSNAASQHTLNWLKQQNGGSGSSSSGSLTSNGFC